MSLWLHNRQLLALQQCCGVGLLACSCRYTRLLHMRLRVEHWPVGKKLLLLQLLPWLPPFLLLLLP